MAAFRTYPHRCIHRAFIECKWLARSCVILVVSAACLAVAGPVAAQSDPPAVPTSISIASQDTHLRVQWVDVPDADSYDIRWKSGAQAYSTSRQVEVTVSEYDIDGLTNGREYTVQVRATNSAGNSAWSSERKQTPSEAPDSPVVRLAPGNASITASWDAVQDAANYVLFWYHLEDSDNNATVGPISETSYTIADLDPGVYRVSVWARNVHGNESDRPGTADGSPLPIVTVADGVAIEGSAVEFVVTLSNAAPDTVTVQYSTSDGTATSDPNAADGADYTAVTGGTLSVSASDTQATISIATGDDMVKELDETFTVTLSGASTNALLGTMKAATGTIRNDDGLGPGTIELCGARVGTPQSRRRDAEVDVCWDVGGPIPAGGDAVIEARERYFWHDAYPFEPWREIARGDSYTACGATDTCVKYARTETWRGLAFEMELRIRRGGRVVATSPGLKAHVPNADANVLRAELSRAIDEATNGPLDAPGGPFVMELQFTDPYLWALLPEIVTGLEPADFEATNATVTGVEIWDDSGTYKVSVAPTTPGEPVTIGLPANRVKGVGEGLAASGGNNYTRDNTASNTVVQETTGPGNQRRSTGPPLTGEFESVPASHRGSGTFRVRLRFSERIVTSYRTLRDTAVTAVGGRVRRADRVKGRSDLWSITVSPSSSGPVTLRVVSRGECGGPRALCTGDGRVLSNSPTVTIDGPAGRSGFSAPGDEESPLPVNRPPRAVGTISPQVLGVEDGELRLDMAPYFADEDAAELVFSAESSNRAAAAVTVAGSLLALTAVGPGTSLVIVTARDAEGLAADQSFAVRVADRWGRAATGDTLAALGRGYLSSARSTLGRRVEGGSPEAGMTVAGQRIPLDRAAAEDVAVSLVQRLFPHAGSGLAAPRASALGAPATTGMAAPDGFGRLGLFGGGAAQALRGTDVVLPLGGAPDAADGAAGAPAGRRWTVWGQGDVQTFRGASAAGAAPGSTFNGDLTTAYVGVDVRLNERWLTGVALGRSFGSGDWDAGVSRGGLTTSLTAIHPYVQWSRGGTTVWALGGAGRGTAESARAAVEGARETSGLGLGMGLVEARRDVAVIAGGVRLGLRGELSWARLTTESGGELLDDLQAAVRRTRAGFEASREWSTANGMRLEPFGRLSVRHDGGAGQTGAGMELEFGTRVAAGLVRVEAQGRMLALHSAAHYEERGASATVSVGEGAERPGLTLSVTPRWGAAHGSDLLWQEQLHRPFGPREGGDDRAVDARVSYGWRLPARMLVAPFAGYGSGWGVRRLQLGARLGALGAAAASPLQLEVSGERYRRRQGAADHRFSLLGVVTVGSRQAVRE